MTSSADSRRRSRAVESFDSAGVCIGKIEPGSALFAVTRGQFSMLDALCHVVEQCAPCVVSIWTWRLAKFDLDRIIELHSEGKITAASMLIDRSAVLAGGVSGSQAGRRKGKPSEMDERALSVVVSWRQVFGAESVRVLLNHAKIFTVEGRGLRVCGRGSANMNENPRFEQFDLTEGGADFDLVRRIEAEQPILPDTATRSEYNRATRIDEAFAPETLALFGDLKPWLQ